MRDKGDKGDNVNNWVDNKEDRAREFWDFLPDTLILPDELDRWGLLHALTLNPF